MQAEKYVVFQESLHFLSTLVINFRTKCIAQFEYTLRALVGLLAKYLQVPLNAKPPRENSKIDHLLEFFMLSLYNQSCIGDFYRYYECSDTYLFNLQEFISHFIIIVSNQLIDYYFRLKTIKKKRQLEGKQ